MAGTPGERCLAEPRNPAVALGERRTSARQPRRAYACLLSLIGCNVVRCCTHNLSETGVYVSAPIGYGLAVGQRYEVLLSEGDSHEPNPRLMSRGRCATVVRTRLEVGPDGDSVGVALRFDRPIA